MLFRLNSDSSHRMLGNLALSLALCIPKACSVDDVMSSLASVSPVPFSYTEQFCRLPNDKPFSAADYIAVWERTYYVLNYLTISDVSSKLISPGVVLVSWIIYEPSENKIVMYYKVFLCFRTLLSIIGVLTVLSTAYDLNHIFVFKKGMRSILYCCFNTRSSHFSASILLTTILYPQIRKLQMNSTAAVQCILTWTD